MRSASDHRHASLLATRIARFYGLRSEPVLDEDQRQELAIRLLPVLEEAMSKRLPDDRWAGTIVNPELDAWEAAMGCRGPRVGVVDPRSRTVS